jgi:hypothetical protein
MYDGTQFLTLECQNDMCWDCTDSRCEHYCHKVEKWTDPENETST